MTATVAAMVIEREGVRRYCMYVVGKYKYALRWDGRDDWGLGVLLTA